MVTTLAPTEVLAEPELAELETVVREGTGAFMRVGVALMKIRDGKGYKLRGFKTFEMYCDKAFGITDRHGRRLIAATEGSKQIEAAIGHAPASESVARALLPLANDPIALQKVQDRLERKHSSVETASAEAVADVVAIVTGKPRPAKAETGTAAPKPNGKGQTAAPALAADGIAELQAVLTGARTFLVNHPWLKADANAARIIAQLDRGLVQLDTLLSAAYSRPAGAKPGKAGTKDAGGPPRCPGCKEPVKPGDPFCATCGASLE